MGYLTVAELKQMSVVDSIKNATEDDNLRLQFLINYCSAMIDSYVGYKFIKEDNQTILVNGRGSNKLRLAKRINSITSVTDVVSNVTYSNLLIVGNNKTLFSRDDYFSEGDYNIEVVGDFGWETVPEDIIDCLVALCNANYSLLNDEEVASKRAGPFKSEKIGNYSYTLKDKFNTVSGDLLSTTGDQAVDQILDGYAVSQFSIEVI